jgi:hypothetical protein
VLLGIVVLVKVTLGTGVKVKVGFGVRVGGMGIGVGVGLEQAISKVKPITERPRYFRPRFNAQVIGSHMAGILSFRGVSV